MSDRPADSSALPPPGESWLPGRKSPVQDWLTGPQPTGEGWTGRRFLFVVGFVFAFHLALLCLVGTKKQIAPRPVGQVPHLQLTDSANELLALGDPTLFARPNSHDVVTAFWRRLPPSTQKNFDWPAPSGYLPPTNADLGAAFHDFMQQCRPPELALNFKPEPKVSVPDTAWSDATPQTTSVEISGELGRRTLLNPAALAPPPLRSHDVVAPSTVQLIVDTAGNVVSAVVLEPSVPAVALEPNANRDAAADQLALQVVRNLRFAPAPRVMGGEITFNWRPATTNAP